MSTHTYDKAEDQSSSTPGPYALANWADVAGPNNLYSPGAEWLEAVHTEALELIEQIEEEGWSVKLLLKDGDALDLITESADRVVPIYTHKIWSVFVDLAAYQEDLSDFGPIEEMEQAAMVSLYLIAERLISATLWDWADRAGDEEETTA